MALLAASSVASAQDWTTADTVRESAVVVASVADWGQTLAIESTPNCYEMNTLLGRHPSRAKVNAYFASGIVLHVLIARMLPEKWRHAFQYGCIGWELGIVSHNYSLGVRISF